MEAGIHPTRSVRSILVLAALGLSTLVADKISMAAAPTAGTSTAGYAGVAAPILVDRWGIEHLWSSDLSTFPSGQTKAFALVFLDVNCPIVTRMTPVLNELHEHYRKAGVQFLGIYSNDGLTRT